MPHKLDLRKLLFGDMRVALSAAALFCVMLEGAFGSVGAVLFFGFAIILAVKYYGRFLYVSVKYWFYLLFPLYCLATTLWSDDPGATSRYSIELLFTFAMALMLGRTLNATRAVVVVFLAATYLVILSVGQVPKVIATHANLVGVYESKNPMGGLCHLEIVAGLVLACSRGMNILFRIFCAGMAVLCLGLITLTHSAGADVAMGISAIVLAIGGFYMALAPRFRPMALVVGGILLILLLLAAPFIKEWWVTFQEDVLHKDTTLTGRTELWDFAYRLIRERPWFGGGISAFWRQGNIDAEGLWRMFDIPGRHGFNFHNSFIEVAVGGGYFGTALFTLTFGVLALNLILGFLKYPTAPKLFLAAFYAAWYARLPTEVLTGPFSGATMLMIATVFYAYERPEPRPVRVKARRPQQLTPERSWDRNPALPGPERPLIELQGPVTAVGGS